MKFAFCFRTPFTKEKIIIEEVDYTSAEKQFSEKVVNKRLPIRVYLDYVWLLDSDDNYIERIK